MSCDQTTTAKPSNILPPEFTRPSTPSDQSIGQITFYGNWELLYRELRAKAEAVVSAWNPDVTGALQDLAEWLGRHVASLPVQAPSIYIFNDPSTDQSGPLEGARNARFVW